MQRAINTLAEWTRENCIPLNNDKTQMLSVSRERIQSERTYLVNGTPIARSHEVKDLGVIFDRKLNFAAHFDAMVLNSRRMLGMGRQFARRFRNPQMTMNIFSSYYLPAIEFGHLFWTNGAITRETKFESQQSQATNIAMGYPDISYEGRLRILGQNKLLQRLEAQQIITAVKIMRQYYHTTTRQILLSSLLEVDPIDQHHLVFDLDRLGLHQSNPLRRMMEKVNLRRDLFVFRRSTVHFIKNALKEFYESLRENALH